LKFSIIPAIGIQERNLFKGKLKKGKKNTREEERGREKDHT
jgi:hypothetical protein